MKGWRRWEERGGESLAERGFPRHRFSLFDGSVGL